MAKKLDDDKLLSMLQAWESESSQYVTGPLRTRRDRAVKDYYQRPYGSEDPGWSSIVTSDVMDTIEWMLPDLLDYFVSSDQAVVFTPTRASEADGAKQATEGCNHVFYETNNGFLILYAAFKDALQIGNCGVHWRPELKRKKRTQVFRNLTLVELQVKLQDLPDDVELEDVEFSHAPVQGPDGQPMLVPGPDGMPVPATEERASGKIRYVDERKIVRVEAFEPELLLIDTNWTSPLLEDCPYVARLMEVSLSELKQLGESLGGFDEDVTAEDLAGSNEPGTTLMDDASRRDRTGDSSALNAGMQPKPTGIDSDDESQTMGWLRIEWVLADVDGDGIAERRCVYRLEDKILHNTECEAVPVCTGSPILVQHRWDGVSVAELVSDLQLLHTELTRGIVNNAYSANNPRKTVMTDANGAPYANVEDVLDGRPGGMVRITRADALGYETTPFVGNQMEPLLQRVDAMREQRTGVTKQRMGMDPNALRTDRTLGETQIIDTASKQRIKLIGRIFAETIVKPIMKGILQLLTSGDFDSLFFKLRDQFVEYDPADWDCGYDMTANVGTGTGDREQQIAVLRSVFGTQMQIAPSPLGPMLVTPRQIYNTLEKLTDLGGFKDASAFYTDPRDAKMPTPPPPPPPYQIAVEQIRQQGDAAKLAAEHRFDIETKRLEVELKQREAMNQNAVQMANDERDAEREALKATYEDRIKAMGLELEKYKVDADNQTRILVASIAHPESQFAIDPATGAVIPKPDPMDDVMAGLQAIYDQQAAPAEIVRDAKGKPTHVVKGGVQRTIVRDAKGKVQSLQ